MSDTNPDLHLVEIVLCTPCMNGEGGECHSPGCAMWLNRAPDLELWGHPAVRRIERC